MAKGLDQNSAVLLCVYNSTLPLAITSTLNSHLWIHEILSLMESASSAPWFAKGKFWVQSRDVIRAVGYLILNTDTHGYMVCQTVADHMISTSTCSAEITTTARQKM